MELTNNPLVCFYDSGIGGLNLLCESVQMLPRVDFTYFADNYRVPYGTRSKEELIKISNEVFERISALKPAAAVIACNTVTAQCIDGLRKKYDFEIIGIQPAVKPAASVEGRILVLATPSTAESESLKKLTQKYGDGRAIIKPCPDLADYLENNPVDFNRDEVISRLPKMNVNSVVLGCTHYIFATEVIKSYYNCPIFDGIEGTTAHLREKIGIHGHQGSRAQKITFSGGNVSKNREIFRMLIKRAYASELL